MSLMICGQCGHHFDSDDKRAFIPKDRPIDCYCPYCCEMRLHGREMWAVWNDCNGVFEVTYYRKEAQDLIDNSGSYGEHETVVPVRVYVEHEDFHWRRHHQENDREAFWGTPSARKSE